MTEDTRRGIGKESKIQTLPFEIKPPRYKRPKTLPFEGLKHQTQKTQNIININQKKNEKDEYTDHGP